MLIGPAEREVARALDAPVRRASTSPWERSPVSDPTPAAWVVFIGPVSRRSKAPPSR